MKSYRFKILIENKPAVLVRILSLIAASNYNINYLLNQKTKDPTISEVIIDIEGKKIILVEGETDRWRSIQHGLPYTAAILGTEVTPYHVSELKKYDTIYIGFDNDSAGFLAKEKAYLKLRPYVEDIRFIPYPSSDPGDSTKVEWIGGILSAVDYAVYSYDMSILVPDYDLIQKTARRFVKDS